MATLRFTGTQYLDGTGQGAMNGNLTIAVLAKRSASGQAALICPVPSNSSLALSFDNKLELYLGGSRKGVTTVNATDWHLLAMTRTTGTTTPRFHIKNITTGAAWVHENSPGGAIGNPPTAVGATLKLCSAPSISVEFKGDVALAAWWDGTALTDPQIESLAATLKTSEWNALAPSSLTELTSLTPTDLKGLETWTNVSATLAGGDPPGWTYGIAAAPVNTVAPAVTGTAVNGQILTCGTGTWSNTPTAYAYVWKRNGTAIGGATSSTYTLVSADKGTSVKCTVTASNAGGSASTDSNAVSVSSTLDALPDPGDVLIRTSTGWINLT